MNGVAVDHVDRGLLDNPLIDDPAQAGKFKTPTLRNIAVTGPYMHDGSLQTLQEVMELYNKGGEKNPFLGSVRVLDLTDEELKDIIAFLESLTSPEYADLAKK